MQKRCKNWILGISYGHHESSCSIISDTGEIFFLREEWLSRVKLDYRFPKSSINYFLKNIIKDGKINTVCHFQKPVKNWLSIGTKKNLSPENYLLKVRQFKESDIFIEKELKKVLKGKFDILFCNHHLSHALGSKLFAKKRKSLYLVMDGYGDGGSGALFDNDFNKLKAFNTNQSLGLLYSAITEWAGFAPNEDEYKVMAIAAFGNPTYKKFIENTVINFKNNELYINPNYFNFEDISLSAIKKAFYQKFKKPNRVFKNKLDDKNLCDVICSFQRVIEETVIKLIKQLLSIYKDIDQIVCSGGLFHNSVLIGKLVNKFDCEIVVPPCPGDPGSAIGAALFGAMYQKIKTPESSSQKPYLSSFIGPKVEDISSYTNLFKKITNTYKESCNFAKSLLDDDESFGTYEGKFEMGPRALGSRSLICNAQSKKAVKKLNEHIKQRESFRPLAIIINENNFKKIFSDDDFLSINLLWMGQVNWSKTKKQLPFLHHDNSSRPQIASKKNRSYNDLPELLRDLSDDYILANTSFNIAGDPMIFAVEDLYMNCIRMGLKYVYSNRKFYEIVNENNF